MKKITTLIATLLNTQTKNELKIIKPIIACAALGFLLALPVAAQAPPCPKDKEPAKCQKCDGQSTKKQEEPKTMDKRYCQSCAMPMGATDEMYGTNADGSKSKDYCKYCFENGAFTQDCTMDEMVEICVPHVVSGNPGMSEDEARKMMREFFPTLKRWKTA